jgi:hypothetical protein
MCTTTHGVGIKQNPVTAVLEPHSQYALLATFKVQLEKAVADAMLHAVGNGARTRDAQS